MGGLFSKPKVDKPKITTDTTAAVDAATAANNAQNAATNEAATRRANLQSNMLGAADDTTGMTSGPTIQKKRLLGE